MLKEGTKVFNSSMGKGIVRASVLTLDPKTLNYLVDFFGMDTVTCKLEDLTKEVQTP